MVASSVLTVRPVSTRMRAIRLRTDRVIPAASAAWFSGNVSSALRRFSACVPLGGVLISMTNNYRAPLSEVALSHIMRADCLTHRFVSLCWGLEARRRRWRIPGTCVYAPDVPGTAYGHDYFHEAALPFSLQATLC